MTKIKRTAPCGSNRLGHRIGHRLGVNMSAECWRNQFRDVGEGLSEGLGKSKKEVVEMTIETIVVPREVADAIEHFRNRGLSDFTIMKLGHGAINRNPDIAIKRWAFMDEGEGSEDFLMQALVNGYRVEKSPHERLRDYYNVSAENHNNNGDIYDGGVAVGVRNTLRILDIKVDGINR